MFCRGIIILNLNLLSTSLNIGFSNLFGLFVFQNVVIEEVIVGLRFLALCDISLTSSRSLRQQIFPKLLLNSTLELLCMSPNILDVTSSYMHLYHSPIFSINTKCFQKPFMFLRCPSANIVILTFSNNPLHRRVFILSSSGHQFLLLLNLNNLLRLLLTTSNLPRTLVNGDP